MMEKSISTRKPNTILETVLLSILSCTEDNQLASLSLLGATTHPSKSHNSLDLGLAAGLSGFDIGSIFSAERRRVCRMFPNIGINLLD